jgi:hypothetical protein
MNHNLQIQKTHISVCALWLRRGIFPRPNTGWQRRKLLGVSHQGCTDLPAMPWWKTTFPIPNIVLIKPKSLDNLTAPPVGFGRIKQESGMPPLFRKML